MTAFYSLSKLMSTISVTDSFYFNHLSHMFVIEVLFISTGSAARSLFQRQTVNRLWFSVYVALDYRSPPKNLLTFLGLSDLIRQRVKWGQQMKTIIIPLVLVKNIIDAIVNVVIFFSKMSLLVIIITLKKKATLPKYFLWHFYCLFH